jgi:hypothetical protein
LPNCVKKKQEKTGKIKNRDEKKPVTNHVCVKKGEKTRRCEKMGKKPKSKLKKTEKKQYKQMYGRTVGAIGVLAVPWTYDGAGEEVGY